MFKYVYERRLRSQLQSELNDLLYEYVSMDENDVETITFFDASGITDTPSQRSDSRRRSSSNSNHGSIKLESFKSSKV